MYRVTVHKPDGRELVLYSRRPIPGPPTGTSPSSTPSNANPHLRWHPLRGEWVAYASHRQNRTFLPPPEYNPLAPSGPGDTPTELPRGDYDVAVFPNLFPALTGDAHSPPQLGVRTSAAKGACEVVVFTQDPSTSLGQLPLDHIELLVSVWADRYSELSKRDDIHYVMPFENRGVEVGVTLHHPHGQLYAYPFIPPVAARELSQQRTYLQEHGRGLLEDMLLRERKEKTRLVYEGDRVGAFVPECARYPYEVWVAPYRPASSLADLEPDERRDFARALKTVLLKYDRLWGKPFPYLMVFHQAPTDGQPYPEAHVHVEFYPAYRSPGKLKFLAGTELGAGLFANDSIPEEKAAELKAVKVDDAF